MPGNLLVTPTLFTKLTLMNLGGYLNVARNMSTDYAKEFGKKGAKIGDTFNVLKPQRFLVTTGLLYQPQALSNTYTPVKVDRVRGVHFDWTSVESALSVQDANERYAKPAALALANCINSEAAEYISLNTANAVGTPGTVPGEGGTDAVAIYLAAGDKLVALGLPEGEPLSLIISRKMSSAFVVSTKTLYNPAGDISGQLKQGEMVDRVLGYKIYKDQTLRAHTVGPLGGAPQVDGVGQVSAGGDNATGLLNSKGWSLAASERLHQGDRFTIDGVYAVHPQTRVSTGELKQFVCLENKLSDGSGLVTALKIYPAITNSGQYQNVDSAPADSADVNVLGAANIVTPQGLLIHKNAYAFLSVPMDAPEPGMGALVAQETDPDTGITLRYIRAFDSVNSVHVNRLDCLFGFGPLYKEMACAICS